MIPHFCKILFLFRLIFLPFLLSFSLIGFAKVVVIRNLNLSMDPANAIATVGDTIDFRLESSHFVMEVSKEAYIAGLVKSNGGFSLGAGGGKVIVTTPGTLYYFCQNHGEFNMKGVINVKAIVTSTSSKTTSYSDLKIYPNPAGNYLTLNMTISHCADLSLKVKSIIGEDMSGPVKHSVCNGKENLRVDLSSIPNGLYFLEILEGDKRNLVKFIKN